MGWLHVHGAGEQKRGKRTEHCLHGGSFRILTRTLLNKELVLSIPPLGHRMFIAPRAASLSRVCAVAPRIVLLWLRLDYGRADADGSREA
jgi:hypothetical protein